MLLFVYKSQERWRRCWYSCCAVFSISMTTGSFTETSRHPICCSATRAFSRSHYYAIYITASQLLDKPCDASTSILQSCNCEFAAISCSEMVQASAKVTIECEYEVIHDLSKWCHCQWPWVKSMPGFNVTVLYDTRLSFTKDFWHYWMNNQFLKQGHETNLHWVKSAVFRLSLCTCKKDPRVISCWASKIPRVSVHRICVKLSYVFTTVYLSCLVYLLVGVGELEPTTNVTRKPSCRWLTRATRKPAKNCSNSTCLQRCRWQYWPIFMRLAAVASEICEIPRNSLKIQTYEV